MLVGETERRDRLLTEIGRLVVGFSDVENVLCVVFAKLQGDFQIAPRLFRSRGSFAEKLILVNEAVTAKCQAREQAMWEPLHEGLRKYRDLRNRVAHHQMIPDVMDGNLDFFLRSPTFTPHRTEDHITADTIRDAALAVEEIRKKLWVLERAIRNP
jgi:hypothetical protein